MKADACSLCILAEVRHAELQSDIARYRSGRQETSLVPSFGSLIAAGWRRLQGARGAAQPPRWRSGRAASHAFRPARAG